MEDCMVARSSIVHYNIMTGMKYSLDHICK